MSSIRILVTMPPEQDWNRSLLFPMDVVCLGGSVERAGHTVKVYHDCPYNIKALRKEAQSFLPQIALLSCNLDCDNLSRCFELAASFKQWVPGIMVVLEGYQITSLADEVLRRVPSVDVVILQEGEVALPAICEAVAGKRSLAKVPGIAFRDSGCVRTTAGMRPDIDSLVPSLSYHLVDMRKITSVTFDRWWPLFTGRGCRFSCRFCSSWGEWGGCHRVRSAAGIIRELKQLKKARIPGFWSNDLSFAANRSQALELCDLLISNKINLPWGCYSRVDLMDSVLMQRMRKAGCRMIGFGVESFSEQMLRLMGKGFTASKAIAVLQEALALGFKVKYQILFGFPGETHETLLQTVGQARQLSRQMLPEVNLFRLYPGARIYRHFEGLGIISDDVWFQGFQGSYILKRIYPESFLKKLYWAQQEVEALVP